MGYYMGDPGFLSFLKGAGKFVGGLVGIGGGGVGKKQIPGIVQQTIEKVLPSLRPMIPKGVPARLGGMLPKTTGGKVILAGGAATAAGAGIASMVNGARMRMGRRGRRMNVTNVRALRRAIRRSQGFAKLARRVLRFVSPKAPRGRAVFKARRRKAA